ncbi:MAG: hypothetical protein U1C73_06925, partial [Dietzia sp.]|nr:hypothetical protein [Dietzia sp.]
MFAQIRADISTLANNRRELQSSREPDSKPVQCEFESHRGHQRTQWRQPPTQAPESVPEVDPSEEVVSPAVESLVGSLVA